MLPHILPGPVHALLRRTAADIHPPRSPTEVRSECISQKIESFLSGVPKARLLFVEGQPQPRQYTSRPLQCLLRLSATEDHEVVRVIDYPRPILFSTSGPLPSLQHPVPVEIGQQRGDHSPLRGAAILVPATGQPLLPLLVPFLDRHFQPHL